MLQKLLLSILNPIELAKELTKDNIYTRMMAIAHQALLSRGLDLLILVSI